jgi:hypothetical protein
VTQTNGARCFIVLCLLSAASPVLAGAEVSTTPLSEDCFAELSNKTRKDIACVLPMRLSDQERADLKAGSRGYVEDVTCTLTVRIARTEIDTAITKAEHIFQSPDQPVVCTVTTPKSKFDITGTFAPRVVFKDDKAIEASPGLGNVKGVSRVISWPVVQFVNRWPSIRSGMLQAVNAYREHVRKKK